MKTNIKFQNILLALPVLAALVSACTKESAGLDNIKLSQTYVCISEKGGDAAFTIDATEAWEFLQDVNIGTDDEPVYACLPTWITTQSALNGNAGKYEIKFHAEAIEGGREQELHIKCGKNTQYLIVRQGSLDAVEGTCAEVIAAADGKSFKVTGTCTAISNTYYGNWYLNDGTGEIYIYGTVNSSGSYDWSSFNIEVGDVVTVQGAKTTYGTTVELVDATFISCEKSLLKYDTDDVIVAKEGCTDTIRVAYKGSALDVTMPQVWDDSSAVAGDVYLVKTEVIPGIASKIESSPADTALIIFSVKANEKASRFCSISFSSSKDGSTSTGSVKLVQQSGLSAYPLPYSQTFAVGQDDWEIQDVTIPEGKSYVWTWSSYKCMVGTPGVKAVSESYLVSPMIDLTNEIDAHVSFDHTLKYAGNVYEELTFWVTGNNGESWEQLLIPYYPTGKDWNFVNSGNISLKAYCGKQVKLRFKYVSNESYYATWEIKNVKVEAGSGDLSSIAEIALKGYDKNVKDNFTATLSGALVTYVNGSNVFIEDATGGILLYKYGHTFNVGDKIDGTVSGIITWYGGIAEATAFDVSSASVTSGQEVTPLEISISKLLAGFNRYVSCNVVLKDVTLSPALVAGGNRSSKATQAETSIEVYAKTKTVDAAADVSGALRCYPSYNGSVDSKEVCIWESGHFTPAN